MHIIFHDFALMCCQDNSRFFVKNDAATDPYFIPACFW